LGREWPEEVKSDENVVKKIEPIWNKIIGKYLPSK